MLSFLDAARGPTPPALTGYRALLDVQQRPHHTVVIADFPLGRADVLQATGRLGGAPTTLHLLGPDASLLPEQLRARGIDPEQHHVSIHVLHRARPTLEAAEALQDRLPHSDLCGIVLPRSDDPAAARVHALDALRRVAMSDYAAQAAAADRFYALLERRRPRYCVEIETRGGRLVVDDDDRWFCVAGPLIEGDVRALPGGEVAYAGRRVSGTFVADGALLASTMGLADGLVALASQVQHLSRRMPAEPLRFEIEEGVVRGVTSAGSLASELTALLHSHVYQVVTEVGVAFNEAAGDFTYDWASPANESRPGAHIALGGDLDGERREETFASGLLHVDLMAATARVHVNGALFLESEAAPRPGRGARSEVAPLGLR